LFRNKSNQITACYTAWAKCRSDRLLGIVQPGRISVYDWNCQIFIFYGGPNIDLFTIYYKRSVHRSLCNLTQMYYPLYFIVDEIISQSVLSAILIMHCSQALHMSSLHLCMGSYYNNGSTEAEIVNHYLLVSRRFIRWM